MSSMGSVGGLSFPSAASVSGRAFLSMLEAQAVASRSGAQLAADERALEKARDALAAGGTGGRLSVLA